MSTARPHDLGGHANRTDEELSYKKAFQTVNRPAVTEHDMHEDYMQDPPNNQPFEIVDRKTRGLREPPRDEVEPQEEGILENQELGKQLKESALASITTESSVHPRNPVS